MSNLLAISCAVCMPVHPYHLRLDLPTLECVCVHGFNVFLFVVVLFFAFTSWFVSFSALVALLIPTGFAASILAVSQISDLLAAPLAASGALPGTYVKLLVLEHAENPTPGAYSLDRRHRPFLTSSLCMEQ